MTRFLGLAVAGFVLFSALPLAAQSTGMLKVKADPSRAGVFLDGKYLGPAANFGMTRTYTVPAGEHEVSLKDPRYQEITKRITVAAGKKTVITEKLTALPLVKPPFGSLRTEHPDKFAAVYVNGHYCGHVDEFSNFAQSMLLPPGEYEVRIEPTSGGAPVVKKVTIEAHKTVVVK